MPWSAWYRLRSYARSSLWIVPLIAIPMGLVVVRLVHWIDIRFSWQLLGFSSAGAQAMLQAIVSATLSFLVFTFASMLVAIQVASGQLTSRIIATTLLRDDVVRYTVGVLTFTFFFAVSALDRTVTKVPQLVLFASAVFCVLSFAAFFYLIDYAGRLLRPISVLRLVAQGGLRVIESVYPEPDAGLPSSPLRATMLGPPDRVIAHQGKSEIVLALNLPILMAEAERMNGMIEFMPQVGDFVAVEEPLFRLYGDARKLDERQLRAAIAFGPERTLEQDPTFAFRIIIDIALRALSPAVNDPTTAVLALDQLHQMLRTVGSRTLASDELVGPKSGELRVFWRTPDWEDFVELSFSEIRHYGADNLQIVRRLRALLDNLVQTLPEHRHPALHQQLALLDREIEKRFTYPEEIALARVADTQGLGGRALRVSGSKAGTIRPARS